MGVPGPLKFVGRIAIDLTVFFLIIVILPGLPPNSTFSSFSMTPPRVLEGTLEKNSRLNKASALLEGQLLGPESIAISGKDVYTGIIGGDVIRVTRDGKMETIAKFGEECGGKWDEMKCGRPLGMRFDSNGRLLVVDAYNGLFRVDVNTRAVETLVSSKQLIDGKLPMLLNDLDVAKTGEIYLSDSSTQFALQDSLLEILSDGSGRLLKHDPATNITTVLIDGLNFANGVQLFPDEESVLICETSRYRVWRYYLKGPRTGEKEVFIDGLPGSPDNIRSNMKGGFLISLIAPRFADKLSLADAIAPFPLVRKFIARVIAMVDSSLQLIDSLMPNAITQHAKYYVSILELIALTSVVGSNDLSRLYPIDRAIGVGHLEPIASLLPKHGLVVEVNQQGEITGSLQDPSGKVAHISEISVDPSGNIAFLGSPYNSQIWALKLDGLHLHVVSVE